MEKPELSCTNDPRIWRMRAIHLVAIVAVAIALTTTVALCLMTLPTYTRDDKSEVSNMTTVLDTRNFMTCNESSIPQSENRTRSTQSWHTVYSPDTAIILDGDEMFSCNEGKKIKSWQWTPHRDIVKENIVNIKGLNSRFLQISNLKHGIYEFILKATDDKGKILEPMYFFVDHKFGPDSSEYDDMRA